MRYTGLQENIFYDFYWLYSELITHKWSMQPYFAKVFIGTGFEPALNWFQSTALTTRLKLPQKNRCQTWHLNLDILTCVVLLNLLSNLYLDRILLQNFLQWTFIHGKRSEIKQKITCLINFNYQLLDKNHKVLGILNFTNYN